MIPQGATVLETKQLCKGYGPVQAVKDLSFSVRAGEIYGFLGLNGAGKTTTIRMLLGLVKPDFGQIWFFGREFKPNRPAVLSRIGSLVETATAYPNLTVRENLELQCALTNTAKPAIGQVLELLQLQAFAKRLAGHLSLGNKQRLSLARALVHSPEFLILDEPINGLDPAGIAEIRSLLRRLASEQGVAILMSSHLLDEVEQVADRIGIIHQGQMIEEFAGSELAGRTEPALELEVDDVPAAVSLINSVFPAAQVTRSADGSLRLQAPGSSLNPAEVSRAVVGAGIGLKRINPAKVDLEALFLGLTGALP